MLALLLLGCSEGNDKHTVLDDQPEPKKAAAQEPAGDGRGISFPISCNAESQAAFDRSLFLLHNMMYRQAQTEFESAIASDDACAMLHWGVAMTQFQPKWPGKPTTEALRSGAAAVERARSIGERVAATTEHEKGHIEAAGAYYRDWENTDRDTRRSRWRDAYGALAARFPDDDEARIFFALGRIVTSAPGDFEAQLNAAGQFEIILEKRPDHPGVLHYLLHAYDNAVHAARGVAAARAYEAIAPDAPHALHMPSHIYVRLGDWNQVIDWNIRSRDAARAQPLADGSVSRHFLHALDYLVYAYLQVADDEKARQEAAKVDAETRWQLNSGPGAYALAAIAARLAVERHAWQEAAALEPRKVPYTWDGYPWAEAVTHAARGLGAARIGDLSAARESVEALGRLKMLTGSHWWQERIEIQRNVICGWVAHQQGESENAEALLRGAAERELSAGKQSVEPGHVVNAVAQFGEFLLDSERPEEALEIFQRALNEAPGRFNALAGAGRAAEQAGMDEEAREFYAELAGMVVAGSRRPEAEHAANFLATMHNR